LNFNTINFHAGELLRLIQPDALKRPEPIDLVALLMTCADSLGLNVECAPSCALGDIEGFYEPKRQLIALREDVWTALHERCAATHRARSTFAHELSHWNLSGS